MKRTLRIAVGLLVAAALVGGVIYWYRGRKPPTTKYETTKVERGNLIARVTATGTLSALVTVQVGSQVSGRIQSLHVDFNSPVKKGQVIARIDTRMFEAAIEQARANLLVAEGNLAKVRVQSAEAERQRERVKALRAEKLVAQADLDTAVANADAARAQIAASQGSVEQARAALNQARINLDYTTIVSPIDGVIISRSVDVGQTVASALQAPTLFTIAEDLRKMQVDTSIAEADVGRLKAGMEATFTVDAYPNQKFKGMVRQVRNAPQTVQNVVTYDAVIDVANPDLKLKPGMTANVTFVYEQKDDVLKVGNAALRFRPPADMQARLSKTRPAAARAAGDREKDPSRRTLWVMGAPETDPTPIRIRVGMTDGTSTEIVEGEVKEGDVVVTDAVSPLGSNAPPGMRRGL